MRNVTQHPIEFADLVDAINTSSILMQDLIGSVHPMCLEYISEYLFKNKESVNLFLKEKANE